MKTYKQAFVVLAVGIFIVPQVASAAWWNPVSWFSIENQVGEQEQSQTPISSSTPERPQADDVPVPDTKTIEGLREEVAVLKARLADLEGRLGKSQINTVVQPSLAGADVSPRVATLEKRVDALSNLDTSRLTKLEKKVAELSNVQLAPQTKNYDSQISEMAKRINALLHASTSDCMRLFNAVGSKERDNPGQTADQACPSIFSDLNY